MGHNTASDKKNNIKQQLGQQFQQLAPQSYGSADRSSESEIRTLWGAQGNNKKKTTPKQQEQLVSRATTQPATRG